jgi:hypothetical protein
MPPIATGPHRGLKSYEMRAILEALFGPKYKQAAADALNVRRERIAFWCDPDQDQSPHASGVSLRREIEAMLRDELDGPDRSEIIKDARLMSEAWDYVRGLVARVNHSAPLDLRDD